MPVARGTEAYIVDVDRVIARGYLYEDQDLTAARSERLSGILSDNVGRSNLAELYGDLELTEFGSENVVHALEAVPEEDYSIGWREGEALAEAWLMDHKKCEFPWPFNRDLRHPRASLPGAELVGFSGEDVDEITFAFGQVKTSKQDRNPPDAVRSGEKCLINQAVELRDQTSIKTTLVNYLAHRARENVAWTPKFRGAATKYFNSGRMEVAIFGVLVRDVPPHPNDLKLAAERLAENCHVSTRIEFCGIYLPKNSIPPGPQHAPRKRKPKEDAK